jgi:branched-chain amino acid transport system permease protein
VISQQAGVPLVVESASVKFGSLQALSDVTITVPNGRIVGVIGPNGAGKSTLMGVIGGQLAPTGGTVRLFGRDVTSAKPSARARAGLRRTFQSLELFDDMTVRENVLVGLQKTPVRPPWHLSSRETARRVSSLLDALRLAPYEYMETRSLSAPIRRWVSYGRAIIGEPRCLLLDEPAAGLAEGERRALAARIRTDADSNEIAVVVVEHDMGFVRNLCDYIYVLNAGAIIAYGNFDEIAANPVVREAYLGPMK